MVSFIITDDSGYYLFPQSRIFSGDEDLTSNSAKISPLDVIKLKNYFFPPKNKEREDELKNEVIEQYKKTIEQTINEIDSTNERQFALQELDEDKLKQVVENLEEMPPDEPDLKRKLDTYISKIQFVELRFEGANFTSKDITIPPKALPYKNEEIRKKLLTKMKLFTDLKNRDELRKYNLFITNFKSIKEKYLTPLTCRKDKSIVRIENKLKFKEEIDEVKEKLTEIQKSLLAFLNNEMITSKEEIKKELEIFIKENPPDKFKDYPRPLENRIIIDEVNNIVYSINFPDAKNILNKLDISYSFYDLTLEDFRDKHFIDELKTRNIINIDNQTIVEMEKVFGTKK